MVESAFKKFAKFGSDIKPMALRGLWDELRFLVPGSMLVLCMLLSGCGSGGSNGFSNGELHLPGDGPGDVERLFPLAVGNTWSFSVKTSESGVPATHNETVTVTGIKTISSESAYVMTTENADTPGQTDEEYLVKNNAGLFLVGEKSADVITSVIGAYPLLKFPATSGASFTQINVSNVDYGRDLDGDGINESLSVTSSVNVLRRESITVPAGTFSDCVRVETLLTETVTGSLNEGKTTINGAVTEWYAPGIGIVKKLDIYSSSNWSRYADYSLRSCEVEGMPKVSASSPGNNATDVPLAPAIRVTFNKEMDPATFKSSFIRVNSGNSYIPGTVTYSDRTATFTPSVGLTQNSTYTVTVSSEAKDTEGRSLGGNFTWAFTTGPGLFDAQTTFAPVGRTEAVAIGDVTGDGRNDVVISVQSFDPGGRNNILVYRQNPAGGLDGGTTYSMSALNSYDPSTIAIGDVNNDGRKDVVVGSARCGIEVFHQNSSGELNPGVSYPSIDSARIRLADMNHDGLVDVVGTGSGITVSIWYQNASGTLNPPVSYPVSNNGGVDLEVADMNNDQAIDVVVMDFQGVSILFQKTDGSFSPAASYSAGSYHSGGIGVGDINGDNRNDIVMASGGNEPNSSITILSQDFPGIFLSRTFRSYDIPEAVEIGDVSNDGRNDIVVLHGGWKRMGVYQQVPDGTIHTEELYPIPYSSHYRVHGLAIGDLNGDGLNDVVIVGDNNGLVVNYQRKRN